MYYQIQIDFAPDVNPADIAKALKLAVDAIATHKEFSLTGTGAGGERLDDVAEYTQNGMPFMTAGVNEVEEIQQL